MKQRIVLIAAVLVGVLAAFATRGYLSAKDREVENEKAKFRSKYRTVDVVVAGRPIPAGSVLSIADIGHVAVVEQQLRHDAIRMENFRDLIGRKTLNRLEVGAPVFWSDIAGGAPGSRGLAEDVKPGCRAISINVSGAAAVSGMVRPNDHVDVIGTFSFPSGEGELELVTLTIIQDVTVLATGTETAKTAAAGASKSGGYSMVTLEVTPREAEMLVFAEQIKGRLALALRNPGDVHYEAELPRVDFKKIESEIESLNIFRQRTLLRKRD